MIFQVLFWYFCQKKFGVSRGPAWAQQRTPSGNGFSDIFLFSGNSSHNGDYLLSDLQISDSQKRLVERGHKWQHNAWLIRTRQCMFVLICHLVFCGHLTHRVRVWTTIALNSQWPYLNMVQDFVPLRVLLSANFTAEANRHVVFCQCMVSTGIWHFESSVSWNNIMG